MARKIALEENADPDLSELASLLHDIPDDKRGISEDTGLDLVKSWLLGHGAGREDTDKIILIISTMSYRGGTNPPMQTIEGRIVQDADRLDAIGAIGIARTFAYSGKIGQKMYDPDIPVRSVMSRDEYRNGESTAINHFHEKLLKLGGLMNTDTARKIAAERHKIMEDFLQQFMAEWDSS